MALTKAMLDELVGDCKTPQEMEKPYSQMLQHMINRSLEAETQAHLGHERHQKSGGNPRNGQTQLIQSINCRSIFHPFGVRER
jgi:putative transposase